MTCNIKQDFIDILRKYGSSYTSSDAFIRSIENLSPEEIFRKIVEEEAYTRRSWEELYDG